MPFYIRNRGCVNFLSVSVICTCRVWLIYRIISVGDDAVLAHRPWVASPPVLGGLKQGMQIKSEVFPEIWTRNVNTFERAQATAE